MTAIRPTTTSAAALAVGTGTAAALAGGSAGVATAWLQGVVSADWNTVANSGAVWTVVAFVVAALVGHSRRTAVSAGLLALVGEVAGYYWWIADVRHIPVVQYEVVLWTLAAIWIGPLAGLVAFLVRSGSREQRLAAIAALAGVVAGEGAYLVRVAGVPRSGAVELVLAAAVAVWIAAAPAVAGRARALAFAFGAATAVAVYLAYRLPTFG